MNNSMEPKSDTLWLLFCVDGYKRQHDRVGQKLTCNLLKYEHMFVIIALQTEALRFR